MVHETICLVTGCSSGIGLALCRELKKRNCKVFASARKESSIKQLQAEGFDTVLLDVTSITSVKDGVNEVFKKAGRIDLLINNAGISSFGPTIEYDIEDVRQIFETNLFGLLSVTQQVAPIMIAQKSGRIINIGSVVGLLTTPVTGPYCASKSSVHSLSDALRMELNPFGIEVTLVVTGNVKTDIMQNANQSIEKYKQSKRYGDLYRLIQNHTSRGSSVEHYAQQITSHMLSPRKLPPRLYAGKSSIVIYILSLLPLFFFHWLMYWQFGLMKLKRD